MALTIIFNFIFLLLLFYCSVSFYGDGSCKIRWLLASGSIFLYKWSNFFGGQFVHCADFEAYGFTKDIGLATAQWFFFSIFWLVLCHLNCYWKVANSSTSWLKVRLSQNEFMKSTIFQNSTRKIWRISALKDYSD